MSAIRSLLGVALLYVAGAALIAFLFIEKKLEEPRPAAPATAECPPPAAIPAPAAATPETPEAPPPPAAKACRYGVDSETGACEGETQPPKKVKPVPVRRAKTPPAAH